MDRRRPRLRPHYCGVGLGVAAPAGIACVGVGVADGAGVALAVGVAVGEAAAGEVCGEAAGVAALAGVGVAACTALGVGLGLGCMFIAFLSASLPSGPNITRITLFWPSLAASCGTAISYCQVDPTNLSPFSLTSQRA